MPAGMTQHYWFSVVNQLGNIIKLHNQLLQATV